MIDPEEFKRNRLLAALPAEQWHAWLPHLEAIEMPLGQVLYEPGETMRNVYFPVSSIVSMLYVMENGASAEMAVVGNEGLLGVAPSWEGRPHRAARLCRAAAMACA